MKIIAFSFRRPLWLAVCWLGWLAAPAGTQANEESCASCGLPVDVTGSFAHYKNIEGPEIQGVPGADEAAFREEIFGREFTVTVPHLPAGKYTVVIGATELYFTQPGQRVFDVAVGGQLIATNYDIVAVTGGPRKAGFITAAVEHQDDSLRGPFAVKFTGRTENAKFNTFEIKNAAGVAVVRTKAADLADALMAAASRAPVVTGPEIWKDADQPMPARVSDLIRRLSLAEKVQQLRNETPAIPRLGVPAYDFWSEALHGVARNGVATVFPQAIGMAATWDTPLIHQEAQTIATEGRAKFNEFTRTHNGDSRNCTGLTFWSPNINIFRDPRWGRGQETYGEDPFLTGKTGVAFIRGLQGEDPKYLKAMACAKHYAVHSGPESERHRFNAEPSERDFYETYLPHFERAVREGRVAGFMGAYNSVFGQPACANSNLLTGILRDQWGFDGYIVSDCGAINDIHANHHFTDSPEAAAAAAVKAGCNICCGSDYNALLKAVRAGLITEREIDQALTYAFTARFRLGLFDPPDRVPFSKITIAENDTPANEALARKVAQESIVLLKNDGLLPLDRQKLKRIAVIGANADALSVLIGNYNGDPARPVTILHGIQQAAGNGVEIVSAPGCPLVLKKGESDGPARQAIADAVALAKTADVIIYVGGISPDLEGEEFGGTSPYDGFFGGDRSRIELPPIQENLLKALHGTGKPVVFVNCSGSAIALPWEAQNLPAIVQAWYPGEQGGRAVADVLFGEVNPSGRLPVTFYAATGDLPPFDDYSMSNRTYRYFNGKAQFAFGHGLSYTKFAYEKPQLAQATLTEDDTIHLTIPLKNEGGRDGAEVAQVYFRAVNAPMKPKYNIQPDKTMQAFFGDLKAQANDPKQTLCGFQRVALKAGETAQVTFDIPAQEFRRWNTTAKHYVVPPGQYELLIGAASDDIRQRVPLTISGR